jgi:hypothetical protein
MAPTRSRRLTLAELAADRNVVIAVQALHDYVPIDKTYKAAKLTELASAAEQARQAEIRAQNALAAAQDAAQQAEWALHDATLRAKAQVIAQYGPDSDAIQSLGLKKKSDRKRPARRVAKIALPAREQS